MRKRGQTIPAAMFILFEVLLVIFAGVIIFNQVRTLEKGGIFHKKFFAPDIALLISTIQQVEGNVYYVYNPPQADLQKFIFDFKKDKNYYFVYVDEEKYPFAVNQNLNSVFNPIKNPNILSFFKHGSNFYIEKDQTKFNSFALDCSKYGKKQTFSSITIDPGHGYNALTEKGDKGLINKDLQESKITIELAKVVKTYIPTIETTRSLDADDDILIEQRIDAIKTPVLISLHIGSNSDIKTNHVKAYVNYYSDKKQESMRLACDILNKISEQIPFVTGTSIVPVDLSMLKNTDSKKILVSDKIAVQLEIGNIQNTNQFMANNQTLIANAIKQAVK